MSNTVPRVLTTILLTLTDRNPIGGWIADNVNDKGTDES